MVGYPRILNSEAMPKDTRDQAFVLYLQELLLLFIHQWRSISEYIEIIMVVLILRRLSLVHC